jgi:hypothetical protein
MHETIIGFFLFLTLILIDGWPRSMVIVPFPGKGNTVFRLRIWEGNQSDLHSGCGEAGDLLLDWVVGWEITRLPR